MSCFIGRDCDGVELDEYMILRTPFFSDIDFDICPECEPRQYCVLKANDNKYYLISVYDWTLANAIRKYENISIDDDIPILVKEIEEAENYEISYDCNNNLLYYDLDREKLKSTLNSILEKKGTKRIFLIRHGESIQNTKENYSLGLPDHKVYLSENGKLQAQQAGVFLKEYVKENNIDLGNAVLWVSPYERTRQTASIINESLGITKVKEDITLIEQRYGLFSDKEIDLIKELYPDEFNFYDNYYQNDGKFYAKLPQGESPFDVALRTKQFIDTIFRDDEDTLFVVSHGTTIRTIIMNWFHYSPEWFSSEVNMENCSIRLIESFNKESNEKYIYRGPQKVKK